MSEQLTDKNGTVFRKGFHRENADGTPFRGTHGQFMPRGGRKPKAPNTPSAPTSSTPLALPASPTVPASPVGSEPLPVSAADVTPLDMPKADAPSAGGSAAELPPSSAETAQPPPTGGTEGTRAEKKPEDNSQSAAECLTTAVEFVAGLVFDAPDDFTPAAGEHASMTKATAAYIRAKGWNFAAGFSVCLVFAAWILKGARKPKARETVKGWFKRTAPDRAKNVTPTENAQKPQAEKVEKKSTSASGEIIEIPANIPPLAQ